MTRLALACISMIALGACGGGGGDAQPTANYEGPIASTDVAHGQAVYEQICAGCHSDGPTLENIGWSAARVRQQVREGSGRMPAIRETRVSADDLEAILAWMVTIGGITDEGGAEPATGGGEEPAADPTTEEAEPATDDTGA